MNKRQSKSYNKIYNIVKDSGGRLLSNKYISAKTKYSIVCSSGHEFEMSGTNIVRGNHCVECHLDSISLNIDKLNKIAISRGGRCLSDTYINAASRYDWECSEGHQWTARANHVSSGTWCPHCTNWSSENICRDIFEKIFSLQFKKIRPDWLISPKGGRLELDGFNRDIGVAFEYNGIQHYEYTKAFHSDISIFEYQVEKDEIKNKVCLDKDIMLVNIPYFPFNNMSYSEKYNWVLKHVIKTISKLDKAATIVYNSSRR